MQFGAGVCVDEAAEWGPLAGTAETAMTMAEQDWCWRFDCAVLDKIC